MTKSKTKIEKQLKRKTNPVLVETVISSKKKKNWIKVAEILSSPRRKIKTINLSEINEKTKGKEIIVVPGKVLSMGDVNKKLKIVALGFSEKAKEKLLKAKCETSTILEEIKKNPEAKNVRILTNTEE